MGVSISPMCLRKAYRSSRALVVSIPKKYAEALQILPGTVLTLTVSDRALHISRAIVTKESSYSGDVPATAGTPVREKGL